MSDRKNSLACIALVIGLVGVAFGGYAVFTSINNSYVLPKARAYVGLSGQALSNSGNAMLNFTNITYDSHGAFNLTSDLYVVPETGYYQVIAQYAVEAVDGDFFKIYIKGNSTIYSSRSYTASATTNTFTVAIEDILSLVKGSSFSIWTYSYHVAAGSRDIFAAEAYTFVSIVKVP
nr:hypothetical protein [Candidatus Sigynarchaeota archaeon]